MDAPPSTAGTPEAEKTSETSNAKASETSEAGLLERLRAGDEGAFAELVAKHHGQLTRLARSILRDDAAADEVVQDAWTAAIEGLDSFEGRSQLGTWLYRIVLNRARTRRQRDGRSVPFSSLGKDDPDGEQEPLGAGKFTANGHWKESPRASPAALLGTAPLEGPEQARERKELGALLSRCLEKLPEAWRTVVTLRDVEGLSSEEVCNALDLSESNQRVLLHRGRTRLRALVEAELADGSAR